MVETLHSRIDERIPATVYRSNGPLLCEVRVERFMGVLIHPVLPLEMQELCGTFRPGGKILVEWPRDLEGWRQVIPGDRLVIEDRELIIRGVDEYPTCYLAVYVDLP